MGNFSTFSKTKNAPFARCNFSYFIHSTSTWVLHFIEIPQNYFAKYWTNFHKKHAFLVSFFVFQISTIWKNFFKFFCFSRLKFAWFLLFCVDFKQKIPSAFKNKYLATDVIEHKYDRRHNHFCQPFRPRQQEFRSSKQSDFGENMHERHYADFRNSQPDQADNRKEKKGFFRACFRLIARRAEDEFNGENPVYKKSYAKAERRCDHQGTDVPRAACKQRRRQNPLTE